MNQKEAKAAQEAFIIAAQPLMQLAADLRSKATSFSIRTTDGFFFETIYDDITEQHLKEITRQLQDLAASFIPDYWERDKI